MRNRNIPLVICSGRDQCRRSDCPHASRHKSTHVGLDKNCKAPRFCSFYPLPNDVLCVYRITKE